MKINLEDVVLDKGAHDSPQKGHCLLEVVSMFSGESFGDSPECVSPVLRRFGVGLNDALDDVRRQELTRFIPRLPGTAGDGKDEVRGFLALDWLVRVHTPAFLRLVPELTVDADRLAQHPPITDPGSAAAIVDTVSRAASHASAARDAFWARAWAGAAAAASAAAWAADDAAGGAAGAAADGAAWDAAAVAARGAAAAAARGAAEAEDALAPTVAALQESAIDLFDRMIAGARP